MRLMETPPLRPFRAPIKPTCIMRRSLPDWLAINKLVQLKAEKASDEEYLSLDDEITLSSEEYLENVLVYGHLDAAVDPVIYYNDPSKPIEDD